MHEHLAKVNTALHRTTLMDAEADEACADEGALHPHHWRNNQGSPIQQAPRIPREKEATPHIWCWLGVSAAFVAGAVFVVWWLA